MTQATQKRTFSNRPVQIGRALRFAAIIILGWGAVRGAYIATNISAPALPVSPMLPVPDVFRPEPQSVPDLGMADTMPLQIAETEVAYDHPADAAPSSLPQFDQQMIAILDNVQQASPFYVNLSAPSNISISGGTGGWPTRADRMMAYTAYQDHMAAMGKVTQLARFVPAASAPGAAKLLSIKPETDFTPAPRQHKRFTLDSWALVRFADRRATLPSLAPSGQLGGSQGGLRLAYALDDAGSLAAFARMSRPLRGSGGSEAAIGISAKPFAKIALQFAVERRIALEKGGRDAIAAYVSGGTGPDVISKGPAKGLEVESYGQAGIVGTKKQDGFADGMVRLAAPIQIDDRNKLALGAAAWGGAQPGVSRMDIGPQLQLRGTEKDMRYRLSVDWRERVAGSARPGSGVAITLVAGF
jgi:hypothetical protein